MIHHPITTRDLTMSSTKKRAAFNKQKRADISEVKKAKARFDYAAVLAFKEKYPNLTASRFTKMWRVKYV